MSNADAILVISTCPEGDSAERIAKALVEQGLAACVNILPGASSYYMWKGEMENSRESVLLIKTHADRMLQLQDAILSLHPYELPEIIAVPIRDGLPAYLNWIDSQLNPE